MLLPFPLSSRDHTIISLSKSCVCVVLKPRAAGESRLPWTQLCLHEE